MLTTLRLNVDKFKKFKSKLRLQQIYSYPEKGTKKHEM